MTTFNVDIPLETFSVDTAARTITGIAVPYGTKQGNGFRFERGALKFGDVSRIKLNLYHERTQFVGVAKSINDRPSGLEMTFAIARTTAGDEALTLAADGVLDGLSVEIDQRQMVTTTDPRHKQGQLIKQAVLTGVALTGEPAFEDARVTRVKMSTREEPVSDTETTGHGAPEPVPAPAGFTAEQVTQMFAAMNRPGPATAANTAPEQPETRQFVDPTRRPVALTVTDPQSYRFDRRGRLQPAAFDFGVDLVRAGKGGEGSAEYQRVMEFVQSQLTFDVQTTDVNDLNPTITLPRYIDQREYRYPIWSAVNRGNLPNGIQPFQWPKFSSASGLVGDHTETQEPNTGSYVTDMESVTPAALSGKCSITRETWDMGGTPGLSDILWRRIQRDWFETLEAKITATLDSASPSSLGLFTPGGGTTGQTLVAEMRSHLARLQFARGGFRFDAAFSQEDLYIHLVNARDTAGRALLAAVSPQNSDGQSAKRWAEIDINGVGFLPAWSLGPSGTASESSYLIDTTAVDGWATPPMRLTFDQVEVRYVHIGVWGYYATAINDLAGVREIVYDPVA